MLIIGAILSNLNTRIGKSISGNPVFRPHLLLPPISLYKLADKCDKVCKSGFSLTGRSIRDIYFTRFCSLGTLFKLYKFYFCDESNVEYALSWSANRFTYYFHDCIFFSVCLISVSEKIWIRTSVFVMQFKRLWCPLKYVAIFEVT